MESTQGRAATQEPEQDMSAAAPRAPRAEQCVGENCHATHPAPRTASPGEGGHRAEIDPVDQTDGGATREDAGATPGRAAAREGPSTHCSRKPLPQSTDSPGPSGERAMEALGASTVPSAEAQGQNQKRGGQAVVRPPDHDHTADGRLLPIGWKSYWSASQQRPFYQHKATKRVVWVRTF